MIKGDISYMQKGDRIIVSFGHYTDLVERQEARYIRTTPEGWIVVKIEGEKIHRVIAANQVERRITSCP